MIKSVNAFAMKLIGYKIECLQQLMLCSEIDSDIKEFIWSNAVVTMRVKNSCNLVCIKSWFLVHQNLLAILCRPFVDNLLLLLGTSYKIQDKIQDMLQ